MLSLYLFYVLMDIPGEIPILPQLFFGISEENAAVLRPESQLDGGGVFVAGQ